MTKNPRLCPLCLLTIAALAGVLFVGLSWGLAQSEDTVTAREDHHQHDRYAALAKVPGKARAKRNPLANDPDAVAAGGKLFEQHCAECHGRKAEGTKRGPSLLSKQVRQATPGALFWIVSNGVVWHGMPDWSKLPEPQRWQIVTFLGSLRSPEVKPLPPVSN